MSLATQESPFEVTMVPTVKKGTVFAVSLTKYRKVAGLTQEELGRNLGVKRTAVLNWENNKSYPSLKTLISLCRLYCITPNDLLGYK